MSCTPAVITSQQILTTSADAGWVTIASVSTGALLANYGLSTGVTPVASVATQPNQHLRLVQFDVEETAASSGDLKKADLKFLFYTTTPTSPSTSAVYNGSTSGYMGQVQIEDTEYKRLSDTVWIADKATNLWMRTGTSSSPSIITVVGLANQSLQYASGVGIRIRPWFELHSNL